MKIVKQLLYMVFSLLLLYVLTRTLLHEHADYYNSPASHLYARGNAPEGVRSEIIRQLHTFQEGYSKRDTSQLVPFMKELFSEENILILGTQPAEIFRDHTAAKRLVAADWLHWGDCTFLIDNANVSSAGHVAWFSTIGYVKFDMSRLLVLPLRLTGILVNENDNWKFQQLQFQFDLNLTYVLLTILIIILWFMASFIRVVVILIRSVKRPSKAS